MLKEIIEKIEEGFDQNAHEKLMEEDSDYQKFFQGKLAKWKVKSPAELDKADRKKFFTEVSKEWK